MAGYPPDSHVMVRPFTHRREGDTVTIGDIDRQVFLAIPAEGMDILDSLAAGHTVGETVRRYEQCYDETPDIEDFLDALQQGGAQDERGHVALPREHDADVLRLPLPGEPGEGEGQDPAACR